MVRSARALSIFVLVLEPLALDAQAQPEAGVQAAARGAADADALSAVAQNLARRASGYDATTSPEVLRAGADALGAVVSRARELGADEPTYARALAAAEKLRAGAALVRAHREAGAGDDEVALETLYRSEGWKRLDYTDVMTGYWSAWAQVSRGQLLPAGSERRAAMHAAERGFSRSSLELALPRIATLSLLGLGVARRELGETARARRVLERYVEQARRQGGMELTAPGLYELATLALLEGDPERAGRLIEEIPPGTLGPEQQLALVRFEAEAWLQRAAGGTVEASQAAREAAPRLRQLAEAGGVHAQGAVALAIRHRRVLAGLDVGPAGDLIAAEEAFSEERYVAARDAYGRVLDHVDALPADAIGVAQYKYAISVSKAGGDRERAIAALESLLEKRPASEVRTPATRLYYAMASSAVTERRGAAAEERAQRAARKLLEVDPTAPSAGHARIRLARGKGGDDAVRMLEQIAPISDSYAGARLELVYRRAEALQAAENAGRRPDASLARKLSEDLEIVRGLVSKGKLSPDSARDIVFAVLAAKVAAWTGRPPSEVLTLVERARVVGSLDRAAQRSLLRLRLRALREAGRFTEIVGQLLETPAAAVRLDWDLWYEALEAMRRQNTPRPPAALLVQIHSRLAAYAPERHREAAVLAEVDTLLRAGQVADAVKTAHDLVEGDPTWGDAWLAFARALDESDDPLRAVDAWRKVASGVERGSARWLEAEMAAAEAALRAEDREQACREVNLVRASDPEVTGKTRRRLDALLAACPRDEATVAVPDDRVDGRPSDAPAE